MALCVSKIVFWSGYAQVSDFLCEEILVNHEHVDLHNSVAHESV